MARPDRTQQIAVLNRTQEQRKYQKQQKVFNAVRVLQEQGKSITFTEIAQIANVSVSYLYKWPEVKDYIQSLRNQQNNHLQPCSEKQELGPHSLKTLHEVARKRISELEVQIQELKRQNALYRGHIAEIYELREENERLHTQLRELTSPKSDS
jgi:C1A family cysteine protease